MLAAVDVCLIARNYFLSEGVRLGLDQEYYPISWEKGLDLALTRKLADGTYYAYFPFASLTEESKMTPYHKKLLHTAANQITITITVINLGYVWEELVLNDPREWEGSLLARVWV